MQTFEIITLVLFIAAIFFLVRIQRMLTKGINLNVKGVENKAKGTKDPQSCLNDHVKQINKFFEQMTVLPKVPHLKLYQSLWSECPDGSESVSAEIPLDGYNYIELSVSEGIVTLIVDGIEYDYTGHIGDAFVIASVNGRNLYAFFDSRMVDGTEILSVTEEELLSVAHKEMPGYFEMGKSYSIDLIPKDGEDGDSRVTIQIPGMKNWNGMIGYDFVDGRRASSLRAGNETYIFSNFKNIVITEKESGDSVTLIINEVPVFGTFRVE